MKNILCVDDVQTNLYTVQALFDTYCNGLYKLILVSSGKDALDVLLSEKIDMILLDIMMPVMDGYETAKLILSNKKTKDIPIIFLTAKKDEMAISKCYDIGGVDYINKPYNEHELFTRIKFHLDLVDSKEKLLQEKKIVQDILDLQDNLIIITDGEGVVKINKATSDFFSVDILGSYTDEFSCLNSMFIKEDGYFHMSLVEQDEFWIDRLLQDLKTKGCMVLLENIKTKRLESFDIKVKKFNNNYLISLTNITSIAEDSRNYEHDAYYDDLTQIYNRAKLNDIFYTEIQNIDIAKYKLSFILLDIDHFKEVNDTYGHLVGDNVLVQMSNLIKHHVRETDVFARWGGEEFVLLLPNVDIDKAVDIANTLRVKIEVEYFEEVNNITCSFGVTTYTNNDDLDTITHRADQALYKAKNSGRNKVCKL